MILTKFWMRQAAPGRRASYSPNGWAWKEKPSRPNVVPAPSPDAAPTRASSPSGPKSQGLELRKHGLGEQFEAAPPDVGMQPAHERLKHQFGGVA